MPIGEVESADLREQNHFRHWKTAMHRAIQDADPELPDEGAWFTVELQAHIVKSSPGWVDGYRVVLTPH
jgi:hypothetical protein